MTADDITLRPWHEDDAPAVLTMLHESPDLERQLPDPEDIRDRLCAHENGTDGQWRFALCLDGRPVGQVAVSMRRMRVGWCSYWVGGPWRGLGLATEGLCRLATFAFTELDAFRLELAHRLDNPASGVVAQRAGFSVEGVRAELEYDGVRYDTQLWSRLLTDLKPVPGTTTVGR